MRQSPAMRQVRLNAVSAVAMVKAHEDCTGPAKLQRHIVEY